MIPVQQSKVGKDGNCFSAALASILEIPLATVPEFTGEGNVFLDQVARFLEPLGLLYIQVDPKDPILNRMFQTGETYHTMEGRSPRGGLHAVVGKSGKVVFDPHPQDGTGRGLEALQTYGLLVSRMEGK